MAALVPLDFLSPKVGVMCVRQEVGEGASCWEDLRVPRGSECSTPVPAVCRTLGLGQQQSCCCCCSMLSPMPLSQGAG